MPNIPPEVLEFAAVAKNPQLLAMVGGLQERLKPYKGNPTVPPLSARSREPRR